MLRLVKENKIWGVVQLVGYQDIESTENLRRGLLLRNPRKFTPGKATSTVSNRSLSSNCPTMDQLEANKHDDQATSAQLRPATGFSARGIHEHTVETSRSRSKKCPSFRHKVFRFVVISPVGWPLFEFDNTLHLLEILRDAIKGHRSLYQDGGILHQDISPINIIITSATKDGDPKGMLIDLGMATKGPPPDNQATGTDQFMAIGVCAAYLPRNPHTYRHDLESFLLVFIFVAICPRHTTQLPPASRLL
jgi:hypothetical protein